MFRRISLLVLLSLLCSNVSAQLPKEEGDRQRYEVEINIRNAYVSGICGMLYEDGLVKASIINEFGVSLMDFSYNPQKDKVRLHSVMSQLDKWYIKRLLRKDLREVMHILDSGGTYYEDRKYKINYTFKRSANNE